MAETRTPSLWLLLDDRAGNRAQVLGVAEALGWPFLAQELSYTAIAALPNSFVGASFNGLTPSARANLVPPWPEVVIAAGRRTAPAARSIKERNGGRTFLCQLMHPGPSGVEDFDLIAVPRHDRIPDAPNVLQITGAPHRITARRLEEEGAKWRERFASLPRPWIALIVGGTNKRRIFTEAMARELGAAADRAAKEAGGSLLITTSRRTGDAAPALYAEITAPHFAFRWGDAGDNPYFAYLGLADAVVVTGDSVSMCSEACASPAPVYIHAPKALVAQKHVLLHRDLYAQGYARPFEGRIEAWSHPPLNAAGEIAAALEGAVPAGGG